MDDLICLDCNHTFTDDDAIRKNIDGETWMCCPECGSTDLTDGARCKGCDEVKAEDELFDGWCKECLLDKLADYELFFEYLKDGDNRMDAVTGLEEFVFTAVWKLPEKYVPKISSFELKESLKKAYGSLMAYDRICGKSTLYEAIKDWMTDNKDPDLYDFAEWLNEREKVKK